MLGVVRGETAHAWSLAWLRDHPGETHAAVGGEALRLTYDPAADAAEVRDAHGRLLPSLRAYWFAWYAFHPATGLTGAAVQAGAGGNGTGAVR